MFAKNFFLNHWTLKIFPEEFFHELPKTSRTVRVSGPVSEFVSRISGSDICSDLDLVPESGGQGLGCLGGGRGVMAPEKNNISVPVQLVQK